MNRYIDADALLSKLPDDLPYKASVKMVLMQSPTVDVVEVVRCKDCKFRKTPDCAMWYECSRCGGQWSWENNYDYCSCGERREE